MEDSKISNILLTEVQLLVEGDGLADLVFASNHLNPFLTYIKFVLTDDKPNANGHRIPKEEFSNLIRTGLYMPIKMAEGRIEDGHEGSTPLGVITHLKVVGDTIRGIAALWDKERPSDVAYVKDRYANGESLDLSWEIGFEEAEEEIDEEHGYCLNLRGCVLRATTLVGIPAYGHGRTSITDVDSSTNEDEESKEENNVDELKRLQVELEELQEKNEQLEASQLTDEDKAKLAEYDELKEFKDSIEAAAARLEKLDNIKAKFSEAGLELEDEFFVTNEEKLLALSETDTLDFFISNLLPAVKDEEEEDEEDNEDTEEEEAGLKIPGVKGTQDGDEKYTPAELARALQSRDK